MLSRRLFAGFCKTQTYIDRFSSLESDVSRLEIEFLEKQEELDKIKNITEMSHLHLVIKKTMEFFNQPYENIALINQKKRIKELHRQYELLLEESKSRMEISQKLKKEEENRREEMFLIDLARFTQIYNRTLSLHDSKCEVLTGLELSLKSLEKLLDKEKVEWIGKKDDPFDHELHERISGNCEKINSVVEEGLRIKGEVVEKAKVK